MSLKQMLDEHGLTAYETLVIRCKRMGVQPPSLAEFKAVVPEPVNSAQEGVVVLEAPKVIDEISGRPIDPEATVEQPGIVVLTDRPFTPIAVVTHPWETITEEKLEALVHPQKKLRPKKGDQPPEQG